MDAFFASVELLRYPQLKGLPVVIGGGRRTVDEALMASHGERALRFIPVAEFPLLKDYVGRGVITTATYAARQFGVGSAMGMMKAARLCPQAIVLPVDFDEIRRFSRLFKSTIAEVAPLMQDRGIDEVYIDFTDVPGGQRDGGRALARLIQRAIFEKTGLTCSIGVAPNRLLAKMASEFDKPNGISIVQEADLQDRIWPLNVRKINGIGPKAGEKLARLGIQTIGELAAQDRQFLISQFGKASGAWMMDAAWGRDDSPVVTQSEPVSMSRETTFERDLHAAEPRQHVAHRVIADMPHVDAPRRIGKHLEDIGLGFMAARIGDKARRLGPAGLPRGIGNRRIEAVGHWVRALSGDAAAAQIAGAGEDDVLKLLDGGGGHRGRDPRAVLVDLATCGNAQRIGAQILVEDRHGQLDALAGIVGAAIPVGDDHPAVRIGAQQRRERQGIDRGAP